LYYSLIQFREQQSCELLHSFEVPFKSRCSIEKTASHPSIDSSSRLLFRYLYPVGSPGQLFVAAIGFVVREILDSMPDQKPAIGQLSSMSGTRARHSE